MIVFGIVVVEVWHTEFPVWAFFLSLAVGASPGFRWKDACDVVSLIQHSSMLFQSE